MLCVIPACDQRNDDGTQESAVTRTAEHGPISLKLSSPTKTVDLGRPTTIALEVIANDGTTITAPHYERTLTEGDRQFEFRVIAADRSPVTKQSDARSRWLFTYTVEFTLPGEQELPGAAVSYVEQAAAGDSETTSSAIRESKSIETEGFTLTVRAPEEAALTPEQLAEITRLDPIELPGFWRRWWWIGAIAALLVVVLVVLLIRKRMQRPIPLAPPIPAHVWANRRLAELAAEDLVTASRTQEFYYRISDIVRGYIERRFGVSAPEMTTEEFFTAASTQRHFWGGTTNTLDQFLTACDLVKYAKHEPTREDAQGVFQAAGAFVATTRVHDESAESDASLPTEERVA